MSSCVGLGYMRIGALYEETVDTLQHTATHCNTLQHTATHCNTLQHTATHCNTHADWGDLRGQRGVGRAYRRVAP